MKLTGKGDGKYLKGQDVAEHSVTVKIDSVRRDVMTDGSKKFVMTFVNNQLKPMILNVTNQKRIIKAYGDETDDWAGKMVEIYFDPDVEMGGETVGGLRVRIPGKTEFQTDETVWTFQECVDACARAGITKDQMIADLKKEGLTAYNQGTAARITETVQKMIEATNEMANTDADIPF